MSISILAGVIAMTGQLLPPVMAETPIGPAGGVAVSPALAACGIKGLKVGAKLPDDVRQSAAGNPRLRILRPGDKATMDFVQDRINLIVDDQGNIVDIRCG